MKTSTLNKIKKALPLNNFKYLLFVVSCAVQAVLSVVFALAVKNLINTVEYGLSKQEIIISAIFLVAVVLFTFLLGTAANLLCDNIVTEAEYKLKTKISKSYLNSSYKKSSSISAGDLVTRFEGDISTVAGVRINLIPNVVSTAFRLLGTIVALFVLQPTFTLIVLAVAVLIVISSFFIRKVSYKLYKKSRVQNSKQNVYLSEVSDNILAVKTFSAENYVLNGLANKFSAYKKARRTQRYFLSGVSSIINLCFTAFYASAVIFGVYGIYNGIEGVNFGVITALLQLVLQIKAPISGISGFFTAHAEMLVAGERLFNLSDEEEKKSIILNGFDKISLSNVSFSYGKGDVLNGVNLEINRGEKILIKGGSGEGKTTLIKLIAGLYAPTNGKIEVCVGNESYLPSTVKNLTSFVPQGNMLFSGTIKENVVFNEEYDEERFNNAVKLSRLASVIEEYGEDYRLGEGASLSEGQRQRVAIARAIYKNSPVIIMDEPTSALDSETELEFAKSLGDIKGATLIIISHKPALSNYVDKVVTIDGGKVI